MFKIGDKVEYVGILYPSLKGQEHEVLDFLSFGTGNIMRIKGHTKWYEANDFILSVKQAQQTAKNNSKKIKIAGIPARWAGSPVYPQLNQVYEARPSTVYKGSLFICGNNYIDYYLDGMVHDRDYPELSYVEVDSVTSVADGNLDAAKHGEQREQPKSEGDRMLAFFAASAHDKKASW